MAILVKKYYCDFRCGRKASDLNSTIEHEKICFKNPSTKSCQTCANYEKDSGGDFGELSGVYCTLKKLSYINHGSHFELWQGESQEVIYSSELNEDGIFYKSSLADRQRRIFPTTNCNDWIKKC